MDLDDIKQILDLVREHDLTEFELERDGLKVRIRKAGDPAPVAAAPAAPVPVVTPVAPPAPAAAEAAPEPAGVELAVIKSPIVGTFYRSSEPGAPSFVELGDTVKKGQVLCIIEAMKLMNEIESEHAGVVRAVLAENGRPVEFGEPLFEIERAE